MSWYADWFLADEAEADAIASIADDDGEHSFEDWPHLAMKSVGEMELMALRGILSGRDADFGDVHGDAFHHESDENSGVTVARVTPAFVDELAALDADRVGRVAGLWYRSESMADWEPETVEEVLREMVEFARRAGREGKPVLQLSVW